MQSMIRANNLTVDVEREQEVVQLYETPIFNTIRFKFIREHVGLRPGKCHLLIGTAGKGKSTLAQSIIHDCARELPILFYDTENTKEDLIYLYSKKKMTRVARQNLNVLHESDVLGQIKRNDVGGWLNMLTEMIDSVGAYAFFFDNLTTSAFYAELHPNKQTDIWYQLQDRCRTTLVPFFIVAHTQANIRDDNVSVSAEDIRGVKTPAIKSEYMYSFQRITIEHNGKEKPFVFVRVLKSRLGNNSMAAYSMSFDSDSKSYYLDEKMEQRDVRDILKSKV